MSLSKILGLAMLLCLGTQAIPFEPLESVDQIRPVPDVIGTMRTGLDTAAPGDVRCIHIAPYVGADANATVTGTKGAIDILRKRTNKCGSGLAIAECGAIACSNSTTIWYCPRTVDDSKLQSCGVLADAVDDILKKCDTKTESALGYKFLVGANNTDGGSTFIDATPCDAPVHIAAANN